MLKSSQLQVVSNKGKDHYGIEQELQTREICLAVSDNQSKQNAQEIESRQCINGKDVKYT